MFHQLGLEDYSEVNIQVLGAEDTYGPHARDTVGLYSSLYHLCDLFHAYDRR